MKRNNPVVLSYNDHTLLIHIYTPNDCDTAIITSPVELHFTWSHRTNVDVVSIGADVIDQDKP